MTPEARAHLDKALGDLDDAEKMIGIGLSRAAARSAYYSAFHAAEALIVERTAKVAKSHSGVRTEFARLLKDGDPADRMLSSVLAQAYKFKELGDYAVGSEALISPLDATNLIHVVRSFLARLEELLKG